MASPSSAAARIQAQQRQMQGKGITCERCGSKHFYQANSVEITRGYGTVEVSVATDSQEFQTFFCSGCHYPVSPLVPTGRKASGIYEGAHKEYRESIKKGQEFLKSLDPHAAAQEALQGAAGTTDISRIDNVLEDVKDRLNAMEAKVLAPEHDESTPDQATPVAKHRGGRPTAKANDSADSK